VFENRVLRRIFGPKEDEVTGERRMRWVGYVASMGEGGKLVQSFGGKSRKKKST
jgi:hypothetical protein